MAKLNHPYVEHDPPHNGWHVYTFETEGLSWRLTTINNGREPAHSLISNDGPNVGPWPDYNILSLDGVLSVDACVAFIERAFAMFNKGHGLGYAKRGADVRAALGI
jgi:hypothetical protein